MSTSRILFVAWGIGLGLAGCATRPVKDLHAANWLGVCPTNSWCRGGKPRCA